MELNNNIYFYQLIILKLNNLDGNSFIHQSFQHIHEGIWILDSNLNTIFTNESLQKHLLQNQPLSLNDITSSTVNEELFQCIKQAFQEEITKEIKLILNDGRKTWFLIRSIFLSPEHSIVAFYFKNIDSDKRTHVEQLHALRNYTSLFEDSSVPIWEEDFSAVKLHIDALKEKGVDNIREHLNLNPDDIDVLATKIIVNKINHAVVLLNEGNSKAEVLSSIEQLKTPDFPEIITKQVEAIFNDQNSCEFDVRLKTLQGNIRFCLFKWTVVKGHEDDYARVFLITTDMTQRIIEENIKLQHSNREIETLIREVHHRVKNNFQIISSLIRLQINTASNHSDSDELVILANRIHSMAAVHELLYNAKKIDTIHLQEYVSHLVKLLIETINISCNISTKINLKNIHLSLDQASTVGLVLNELITNSIKHGFANRDQGLIEISGTISDENTVKILFSDNGIGIQHVKKRKNSLGLELATNLIEQIDGQLIPLASQEGTKFNIIFPHS